MLRTRGFGLASLLVTLSVALGLPSRAAAQNWPGTLFVGDGTGLFGALQSAISPAPFVVLPAPAPAPVPALPTASPVFRTDFASFAQPESSAGSTTVRLVESTPATSTASAPRVISYQGVLKNATGSLAQDGDYTVTMRLYGDSIGIKELWRDTYRVQVQSGVFDILLGSGQQPLPESAALDQPMWISMQMGALDEMRPFAQIASVPYALNVADKSITAGKISADYVRSLSVNGQTVTGNGAAVSILTGDGLMATIDPATGAILLKNGQASLQGAKGGEVQGNTTISGSLTVTGTTYLGSGGSTPLVVNSLSASKPVKTNSSKGLVSGTIDLSNGSETDVSGTLGETNGGTGQSGYTAGDMLYASSSSALSKLGIGTNGQVLAVSGGVPAWVNESVGEVTSFNTRTGAVTSQSGDYSFSQISGAAAATQGGTGQTGFTTGDMLYASSSTALSKLGAGTEGQMLTISGGVPAWVNASTGMVNSFNTRTGAVTSQSGDYAFSQISGTAAATQGGTGQSSYTPGDILVASSSTAISKLGVGSANQVLGVSGGVPAYVQNGATITNTVNSPANLTSGPVNNYSVDGSSTYIRLNNTSGGSIDLTGINNTSVANGRSITLVNTSAASADIIVIRHHNGSSTSGNQFDLPGGGDIILAQRGTATFIYDVVTGYWELTSTN